MRVLLFCCLVLATSVASAQVYKTPESARSDPDFLLQGEYADGTRGMQVIAEGEGQFQVKIYPGGLPAAGWDGSKPRVLQADDQTVAAMVEKFERVDRKSPTLGVDPPAGAVVLFDGTQESLQQHWREGARMTEDGLLMEGATSKQTFGDYTLHLEFRLPFMPAARGQKRANSGLYHQGRYETQILDSFGLEGKNNEAGGIYEIRDPDVNVCYPPLAWQTYDVDFTAARYDDEGEKTANAKITVRLNGVVVHRDVEVPRATRAAPVREGPEDGPIYLQNHGDPVRFRNIWVKPRDVDAEARRPIVPGFERFDPLATDDERGKLLLSELNCVACHQADQQWQTFLAPKQAPILDDVGKRVHPEWLVQYIADPRTVKPGTTMPDVMSHLSAEQRHDVAIAITNFLIADDAMASGGKRGDTAKGERLFHQAGCIACHLPRDGRTANRGTSAPLVGLHEKYSRSSLQAFLKDPLAVRPSGRMPRVDLGDQGWTDVAQYLTGDVSAGFGDSRERPEHPNMKYRAYEGSWREMPDLDEFEPYSEGVARGLDIGVAGRTDRFAIRFEGFLSLSQGGEYHFRLASDDGSRLWIDGRQVIDNDGIHPHHAVEGSVPLQAGVHSIQVDYFEYAGEESLTLQWAGPGIESGSIDRAIHLSRDRALAVKVGQVKADSSNEDHRSFIRDRSLAEEGRKWFVSLGCAACHVRHDNGRRLSSPQTTATALDQCDPDEGCLDEELAAGIPDYELSERQRRLVATAVSSVAAGLPSPEQATVHRMASLNCYACHRRDQRGDVESDRNQTFVSSIPEMGDEGRLPPPLDGVGDKLRSDWMIRLISAGDKSRPYMKTHMPGFGQTHAEALVSSFVQSDLRTAEPPAEIDMPPNRLAAIGRHMVGSKGLACVSCHTFGEFKSTGIQAIALDTMAARIREDWFYRYLLDPQRYRPGTRMPTGYPEGKSTVTDILEGDPDQQIAAMWAFLETGTSGGVPEGIVSGMIELKPDNRPILYRNFISDVSPRGIAVGYPEKVNLCWDAESLSLALIWQDRFIDASKHWVGRGPGKQSPLGGNLIKFESIVPVAILPDQRAAWPSEMPASDGYRFVGYRLDSAGRPTFRYRNDHFAVEDRLVPVAGDLGGTLRRELTVIPDSAFGSEADKIFFRAGFGEIAVTTDGWFVIDGSVRVRVSAATRPTLRTIGGVSELIVPIESTQTVIQEIVW